MINTIESKEFILWFEDVKEIVETHNLTRDSLDPWDFIDHFIDGYEVMESIAEYFDFDVP